MSGESASDAPEELFAEPRWYACYTRARSEKKAERLLKERGIETYLPLVERQHQWADRMKTVSLPLFPSYVFARFALSVLHEVLDVPLIATVARPNGYPTPVRDEELEGVRRLVEGANRTGQLPEPADFLEAGDPVVVMEGPFEGMSGVLLESRSGARVVLRIRALRQATSVAVPRSLVRPDHRPLASSATGPA